MVYFLVRLHTYLNKFALCYYCHAGLWHVLGRVCSACLAMLLCEQNTVNRVTATGKLVQSRIITRSPPSNVEPAW